MEDEEWRIVRGLSGLRVSSYGRVGVFTSGGLEVVEPSYDERARLLWVLVDRHGVYYKGPVVDLLVRAFYSGMTKGMRMDYRDGNPRNVSLENCEPWAYSGNVGRWERIYYRMDGNKRRIDKRVGGRVEVIETGEVYGSVTEAAKAIGGQRPNVSACLAGRLMSHRGFTFRWY